MATKIPDDLKAAYVAEKKMAAVVKRERAKSVTLRTKLDQQNQLVGFADLDYVEAREVVRTLERTHDIGDWAPSDIPPTVIGFQEQEQ
jgi:hypothetical protein